MDVSRWGSRRRFVTLSVGTNTARDKTHVNMAQIKKTADCKMRPAVVGQVAIGLLAASHLASRFRPDM
ncbi:hypothetical protein Asi02nite_58440 [Asanoa siamensis]|uniref:Uncharacterized protein n=1 Tax=Asanoa siamensis TaxID=926357 RepID=A0ABQ4CYJ2_9ACTN|nr:hypothetical protein Asi02nite_58440 [Asanoa siamensis]